MPNNPHAGSSNQTIGVILMTYGSATTAEHVAEYMAHIYKDKVPEGIVEDFAERYRLVGRSPLVDITRDQAAKLEHLLNQSAGPDSPRYRVQAGMLHSEPFIDTAVANCRQAGAERIIGIIMSPQFSSFIMDGYRRTLAAAAINHGFSEPNITVAEAWPTQPHFIKLLATRVTKALTKLRAEQRANVPVVFTTHSLPQRVVEKDPGYLDQLAATTNAVIARLSEANLEWYAGYQSAGHSPEEWLKPDLVEVLAHLRDQHHQAVLIVPVQFLTDHLEILYDLDIAAAQQCQEYGIDYHRIELPNTDPQFIEALAAIARTAIAGLDRVNLG